MSNIPDADAPSNPFQAITIGNLITGSQLHWLTVVAGSVGISKEEAALELFNCPVNSLSRGAATSTLSMRSPARSGRPRPTRSSSMGWAGVGRCAATPARPSPISTRPSFSTRGSYRHTFTSASFITRPAATPRPRVTSRRRSISNPTPPSRQNTCGSSACGAPEVCGIRRPKILQICVHFPVSICVHFCYHVGVGFWRRGDRYGARTGFNQRV